MWMWRSTHEALVAEKDATIRDLRRERIQLLKTLLRLRERGAVLPPKGQRQALSTPAPDHIGVAIEAKAEGDVRLAKHLRLMAMAEQAKGTPTDEIVQLIRGQRGDED